MIGGSVSLSESLSRSGYIQGDRISSVVIGGSIVSGMDTSSGTLQQNASIRAANDIGAITVRGSLVGNTGDGSPSNFSPVIISARGQLVLDSQATTDMAIRSLIVGGHVERAQILAGYGPSLVALNGNGSIGGVTVNGDWIASDLVAGVREDANPANPNFFGDADDELIPGGGGNPPFARINSIAIRGTVIGTGSPTNNHFGFVAEQIGSFRSLGFIAPLTSGFDSPIELSPLTLDVTIREVT